MIAQSGSISSQVNKVNEYKQRKCQIVNRINGLVYINDMRQKATSSEKNSFFQQIFIFKRPEKKKQKMKNYLLLLILILSLVAHGYSQSTKNENRVAPNSISGNILGTGSYIGLSYEKLLFQRLSLEAGVGIIGYGGGMTWYAKKAEAGKLGFYTGVKATTHAIVDGEHKTVAYLPIGFTWFAKSPINIGLDIGPAYRYHHSPGYMPTPAEQAKYPFSDFGIFGNMKVGVRF